MKIVYDSAKFVIKEFGTDPVYLVLNKETGKYVVAEGFASKAIKDFIDLDLTTEFVDTMCAGMLAAAFMPERGH